MASTDAYVSSELVNLLSLEESTIIITGGTGGLGLCLCTALCEAGADVICMDLAQAPNAQEWSVATEIAKKSHKRLEYIQCNVASAQEVTTAFASARELATKPIKGLVTSAGISGRSPAITYPVQDFRKILEVNVIGTFLCAQQAAVIFREHNMGGSIVMLASISAYGANQGVSTIAYNASKAAVIQMARSMAAEWGSEPTFAPIRVNTLSPGYISTPISEPTMNAIPGLREIWTNGNMLMRLSSVEEYRSAVLFLLGKGSSYMTGADLCIDGGHTAW